MVSGTPGRVFDMI